MDARDIIKNSTVNGRVVTLPAGQLDRKLYQDVAKLLEGAGGKWSRKDGGFIFAGDPDEHIATIIGGGKVNIKKEFQFFETPADVAEWMVREAAIGPGQTILEPSAGQGALINAIRKEGHTNLIAYIELMPANFIHLRNEFRGENYVDLEGKPSDFLNYAGPHHFDRIIANPPFANNQDIDHIRHMYHLLAPGGRLVSLASKHWQIEERGKKEGAFRKWVDEVDASIYPLSAGRFKSSGTMVETVLLVMDK